MNYNADNNGNPIDRVIELLTICVAVGLLTFIAYLLTQ